MRSKLTALLLAGLLGFSPALFGRGTYLEPAQFVAESFAFHPPQPRVLYLRGEVKQTVQSILGHRFPGLRIRYWMQDTRTAWILDEVGKERPITVGIVVDQGHIERVRILVFRESRGDEVRHPFFTEQFRGAGAGPEYRLDRHIDNIAGATLSVRAVRKLVRLALYLDQVVRRDAT